MIQNKINKLSYKNKIINVSIDKFISNKKTKMKLVQLLNENNILWSSGSKVDHLEHDARFLIISVRINNKNTMSISSSTNITPKNMTINLTMREILADPIGFKKLLRTILSLTDTLQELQNDRMFNKTKGDIAINFRKALSNINEFEQLLDLFFLGESKWKHY